MRNNREVRQAIGVDSRHDVVGLADICTRIRLLGLEGARALSMTEGQRRLWRRVSGFGGICMEIVELRAERRRIA